MSSFIFEYILLQKLSEYILLQKWCESKQSSETLNL